MRITISVALQRIFRAAMAYFGGCAAASLTMGIMMAVNGMFFRGSAGLGVEQALSFVLFMSALHVFPILLFALPGYIISTLVFAVLKLQYHILYILAWALNGAAAADVLASMGKNPILDDGAIRFIFFFAIAGAAGGEAAWAVRSKTQIEYWGVGR